MTCIIGLEYPGGVILAGDSFAGGASDTGSVQDTTATPKVFRVGDYGFGFTSSFRMGDLLRYHLELPPIGSMPEQCVHRHVVTTVIPAIRECLKVGGYAGNATGGQEQGGNFLLAVRGCVFEVQPEYSVMRFRNGYAVVGAGCYVAMGALAATSPKMDAKKRVKTAMLAAEKHCPFVKAPFSMLDIKA
jgi:hypothetical protein